jgi:MbtH protein
MTSPFDQPDGTFAVLVNDEGQHSLWPDFAAVPAGWTVAHGPAGRDACLQYTVDHRTAASPRGGAA